MRTSKEGRYLRASLDSATGNKATSYHTSVRSSIDQTIFKKKQDEINHGIVTSQNVSRILNRSSNTNKKHTVIGARIASLMPPMAGQNSRNKDIAP